jgi:arsenate reductase
MTEVTIYHNPDCGTSRNTLALIRHAGVEPTVIDDILPLPQPGPFVTEDGEPVIDSDGRRVSSRGH